MNEAEEQSEAYLISLEQAIAADLADDARFALRHYLFTIVGLPVDGSVADAVAVVAQAPAGRSSVAAVVLRALAVGIIVDGRGEQLPRNVVALCEGAVPQLCSFLKVQPKSQNYEKLERLRGAHESILGILEPLRTPYASLDTLVGAKPRLAAALQHSQVKLYCRPWHVDEAAELVDRLLGSLCRVLRMDAGFEADLETSRREIAESRTWVGEHPSFIADLTHVLLTRAEQALDSFLGTMKGRFLARIVRADREVLELQKRYPLHEEGRELRVVVPFRNEGPGPALDVTYSVSSIDPAVVVDDKEQVLGEVAPGEFGIAVDVLIAAPCEAIDLDVEVHWREVGEVRPKGELFPARLLAQRADVDWAGLRLWRPYSTEPAEGSGFYGRQEQVQTLVARFLQRPMEPTYITGQKRVGKTSLARTAIARAEAEDVEGALMTGEILWGRVHQDDARRSLTKLGEAMERIVAKGISGERPEKGDYDGSLTPLLDLLDLALERDPTRRYAIFIDEFDEMPEALWLQGDLAVTLFNNIRALTGMSNFSLLLVGGENMPFVMERQGARLNRFNRLNLTYFSRSDEFDEFARLIREPSEKALTWHSDAVSAVFNMTNGNPYFSNIICKEVAGRAVVERDGDITAREVERAVTVGVAALDTNAFMHLWEDGTVSAVEEREAVVLKRRRALAALARCLRAGRPATLAAIAAHRGATAIDERELGPVLHNLVDRGVLVERDQGFEVALPIFRLWLMEVGVSRLANDGLSEELASIQQRADDEAFVTSAELTNLTDGWKPYCGRQIGPESVRQWLEQVPGNKGQRVLFRILQSVRIVGQDEVITRLKQAGQVIRDVLGVPHRRSKAERRTDVVLTYVDGEGKSGQRYASDYAEANFIETLGILPPAAFDAEFERFTEKYGVPKAIVIIDDVVGTGGTLSKKLTAFVETHRALLDRVKPRIEVCSLFATDEGRRRILATLVELPYPDIDFRAGEIFSDDLFAFRTSPGIFGSVNDYDRARSLAEDVGSAIYGAANALGFGRQGLLLVLPNTVPNNSLPILHSPSKDADRPWRPLFRRVTNG